MSYDESNWNYAEAYLKRVDSLFQAANMYKLMGNNTGWFETLCSVHDELAAQMKGDEEKESTDLREKCKKYVNIGHGIDAWLVKKTLSSWEIFMRKIMKERGMDLPRKFDPSKAMFKK